MPLCWRGAMLLCTTMGGDGTGCVCVCGCDHMAMLGLWRGYSAGWVITMHACKRYPRATQSAPCASIGIAPRAGLAGAETRGHGAWAGG